MIRQTWRLKLSTIDWFPTSLRIEPRSQDCDSVHHSYAGQFFCKILFVIDWSWSHWKSLKLTIRSVRILDTNHTIRNDRMFGVIGLAVLSVLGLGLGPSIGLAMRENQKKNIPLKQFDLAKALVYTSFQSLKKLSTNANLHSDQNKGARIFSWCF